MNYLAHLYLSDPDEQIQLGNLMGDFVKGRLCGNYPEFIEQGIQQHRCVDSFARNNQTYQRSWQRLDPTLRHIRPLLIDIFYDHFLARHWDRLHPSPLDQFSQQVYKSIHAHMEILPDAMKPVAQRMIDHDWLTSYAEIDTVDRVLERMSRRFRYPVDLTPGSHELRYHYRVLESDSLIFLHEAHNRFIAG